MKLSTCIGSVPRAYKGRQCMGCCWPGWIVDSISISRRRWYTSIHGRGCCTCRGKCCTGRGGIWVRILYVGYRKRWFYLQEGSVGCARAMSNVQHLMCWSFQVLLSYFLQLFYHRLQIVIAPLQFYQDTFQIPLPFDSEN